ncbi:MAG: hypothetical protein ABI339_01605 [Solirubrobacteraceae bacterium]
MIRSGARLAYPASWRAIQTDRGTVSAAPAWPGGSFAGYLNATPLGGDETLANWSRFRVTHVAEEGARRVRLEATATALRFRAGHGSCVIDSYSTTRARFGEIACIVAGARATTVVVAAVPAAAWARQSAVLERAVAGLHDMTPPVHRQRRACSHPAVIAGCARTGKRTRASISWTIAGQQYHTSVSLRVIVEDTALLDGVLLRLGGRRWLQRRFAHALACLAHQLAAAASPDTCRGESLRLRLALESAA